MERDFDFFQTSMPESRKADYYLGCLDGSVFLDFNETTEKCICLCRISFDGFGCCNLGNDAKGLDDSSSKIFRVELNKDDLDQAQITKYVLELIQLNKGKIWNDALLDYGLI